MKDGLILDNLRFTQGDFNLSLSLNIPQGAFACVLGPSGCGKTTLLSLIGGFITPGEGSITLQGRDITDLEPHHRRLGIVFQDYALFPHLSVEENIAYGLKTRREERPRKEEIRRRISELLELVELEGYENRRVPSLSGGEQQRIALARALAPRPDLLLLDEPLSALDVQLRGSLRREIRRIQERLGITTLYITHDQEEALTLADRIYLMRQGRLLQEGSPEDIYANPQNLFTGRFLGRSNTLAGRVKKATDRWVDFQTAAGPVRLPIDRCNGSGTSPGEGDRGTLFFRPEDCVILPGNGKAIPGKAHLTGELTEQEYYGSSYLGEISCADDVVRLFFPLGKIPRRGESVAFTLQSGRGRWFKD